MGRIAGNRDQVGILRGISPLAALWGVGLSAIIAAAGAQEPTAGNPEGVEVLTRGPVHEAYAVPVVNDPKPGLIVPKKPPEPIEEMPPDQKPSGEDVQWMPGYWSWDQSREDFIWVSGIWREPPPGRQWVPGYWNPVANGCQWIPGAWIPVPAASAPLDVNLEPAQGQAAYLSEPPASLEVGPNIPRPAGEVFWSPGCWYWRQTRYVWRPGFWAAVQPTWVWVPAHYVWTPGGCLFVEGYWDLPLVERGILFAPVYYSQPVYLRPAYVYTPTITIAAPGLVANLFVQPSYNHYCFGDYYDRAFLTAGVFPWFSFTYVSGPRPPAYYDPLFTFYASVNVRSNPGWVNRCREDYALRRDNVAMRPPRTYIEQTRIVQTNVNITRNTTIINQGGRPGPATMIGRPIEQVAMARRAEPGGARMERIDPNARRQWQARSRELTDFRVRRAGGEAADPRPGPGGPRPPQGQAAAQARPRPFAMPASPVSAPMRERAVPAVDHASGPMRRPERTVPATRGPGARPAAPRHAATEAGPTPSIARPGRREAPIAHDAGPLTRGPVAAVPKHQAQTAAPRPAIAHPRDGARPAPAPGGPALGNPSTPRHLREGGPQSQVQAPGRAANSPRAEGPRFTPRRPPPTPRPAGPAARGGPRRGNDDQRAPNPNP